VLLEADSFLVELSLIDKKEAGWFRLLSPSPFVPAKRSFRIIIFRQKIDASILICTDFLWLFSFFPSPHRFLIYFGLL
jgi:hypothetical protein